MKTIKQLEQLRKAHQLIKQENTGTPSEFANKLNISNRQIYNITDYLKEIDAPIEYNRKTETYYYTTTFDLLVNVSVQVLIEDEVRNIYAGSTFLNENFLTARLLQCTHLY